MSDEEPMTVSTPTRKRGMKRELKFGNLELEKIPYSPIKKIKYSEPLNKTYFYKIRRTNNKNLLTLNVLDLPHATYDQLYVCMRCYINPYMKCQECIKFYRYNKTFLIETLFGFYKSPPPTFFTDRNFNFFKTFIKKVQGFLEEHQITDLKTVEVPSDDELKDEFFKFRDIEVKKFESFLNYPFNNGILKQQFSGKKSIIRNMMLGKIMPSMRYVLTIDTQLGPDEVSIPKIVYDKLNLKTNFVIVNRAPSINDTCIYVAILKYHDDSFTAKLPAFIADGLHADQDGDEITIFMLSKTQELQNYNEMLMMKELRNSIWSSGIRHKFDYSPKISFGQYYQYVMYLFHDKICEMLPIYAKLPCAKADKPQFLMNLLCGSHYHFGVNFISDLMEMVKNLPIPIPSYEKVLKGELNDIVDSKSKGSSSHLDEFVNMMHGLNERDYHSKSTSTFNKYITSSCKMSQSGQQLYSTLFGTSSLNIKENMLFFMSRKLTQDFYNKQPTECVQYNRYDILLLKSMLLNDVKNTPQETTKIQIKKPNKLIQKTDVLKITKPSGIKIKTITKEHAQKLQSIVENVNVKEISSEVVIDE